MPTFFKGKQPPRFVIGVDESGIGAIAGPFTVAAFMSTYEDGAHVLRVGARDSKKLSHRKRTLVADRLLDYARAVGMEQAGPLYPSQREAWRQAIARAVVRCLYISGVAASDVELYIDGLHDARLSGYLEHQWKLRPVFLVRGEDKSPQVAAASIFAKTWRSELMHEAYQTYPEYGWSDESGHGNDGYGTEDHFAAIRRFGVCSLHRRVKPLIPYFQDGGELSDAQEAIAEAPQGAALQERSALVRAPVDRGARSGLPRLSRNR
jgi:ribonuclease HII